MILATPRRSFRVRLDRTERLRAAGLLLIGWLLLGFVREAQAANVHYNAASGDWTDANWTGGVGSNPPQDGDSAFIGSNAGATTAAVDITTDVSSGGTTNFPSVTVGNNGGTDGTLDLEAGGTLQADTLTVGNNGDGTFNHNGGTLNVGTVDMGTGGGTGIVNLNGTDISVTNFNFGGTGSSVATLNRGGANVTVTNQLEVEGSNNTWAIDTGDDLQTKIRVDSDGTVDLNGVAGFTVPTLQIGGGTPGNLARTGGGTFDVTTLDVAGGSSVSTVSGDATDDLTVRQAATFTLGDDLSMSGNASIREGSTLNLDGNELAGNNITLGTGSFTINRGAGGTLNASNQLEVQGSGNTYVVDTSDTIGGTLRVDSDGTVDLNGVAGFTVPTLQIGGGTPGNIARTGGGTFDVTDFLVRGGSNLSTVAGDAVSGTLEVRQTSSLTLGADLAPTSVTVFESSTLDLPAGRTVTASTVSLGGNNNNPQATLNLGTAAGTATLSGSGAENLTVSESGELRGWGVVDFSGQVFNAGRIVADGFGTGVNPLDLSSFSTINAGGTGRDNQVGEDHGWFARNAGKLIMPDVGVGTGSGVTVRVGESATTVDTNEIDMINSLEITFDNVTQAGTLSVDILAVDNPEVAAGISGAIGVFEINVPGVEFDQLDLTIRYDDILADTLGINQSDLKLFQVVGGFTDVTTSVDTVNKLIFAEGLSSLSQFAIALDAQVPEPSGGLLLAAGMMILLPRRRRRRIRKAFMSI